MTHEFNQADFNRYYEQLKERSHDFKRYSMSVFAVNMAREAYRQGGFPEVASRLRHWRDDNRFRVIATAIVAGCDNWRYGMRDLETAISLAEDYAKRQ